MNTSHTPQIAFDGHLPAPKPSEHSSPRTWLAVLLTILVPPAGMLYVRQPGWALLYFLGLLALGVADAIIGMKPDQTLAISLLVRTGAALHASSLAAAARRNANAQPWYSRLLVIVVLIAIIPLFRIFLFEPFRVPSNSMTPNIPAGSFVIVRKWGYGYYDGYGLSLRRPATQSLEAGDVVAYRRPMDGPSYIDRIVGLPGDTVMYLQHQLIVNGVMAQGRSLPPYTLPMWGRKHQFEERLGSAVYSILKDEQPRPMPWGDQFPPDQSCNINTEGMICVVPPGHVFVLGDYRDVALDSRMWGFLPQEQIIGKVVTILP